MKQYTVGEIVAKDARAAAIFEQFHIDFCCNGHKTLEEACADTNKTNIVESALQNLLNTHTKSASPAMDYHGWPIDLLADLIEKKYHRETTKQIDVIKPYLDKICRVHGTNHPELFEIKDLFEESAGELTMHMKREELMLFPFIRKMVENGRPPGTAFGTVDNPIRALTHEHQAEGERFRRMAKLTNDYTAPADGCQTYRLALHLLKEFESMLHFHIHLENNLLFPQALAMAKNTSTETRLAEKTSTENPTP